MAGRGGRSFGLIQPTLIQQLKKILDEYPDDGQILKELIQNAEDAGASQVKFLHDRHSHGTSNLYDDDLAEFQGPALYAYNDARFSTEDWTGIQLLNDSIKLEDPMKVGRFGLGFKSVFHITDLPSLLSDSQIGFIDPHGVYFSDKRCQQTGKLWHLQEDQEAINMISGQFSPYKGIFDCTDKVFSDGCYDGTLFRFPLRSTPSELSETVYSAERVETLFESFKADAHLMLLFLRHLEEIELYVREELEPIPRKVFQVKIAEESLQTVRAKRKEFRENIAAGKVMSSPVAVTYPITIETVNFDFPRPSNKKRHRFLVTSYFCGGKLSWTFQNLISDKVLSYLPSVGVAMPLPTGPKLQTPDVHGHVFCSLPLPVQKTSLTGLPVHVNGFFALSQNRRYIKSPNAEQEQQVNGGRLIDKSLLWNKCLLEEAIPRAYATMILEAISENSLVFVPKTTIYKAWPDVKQIRQNWDKIAEPLLQILLENRTVYTDACGGKWLTVKQAFFDLLPENETRRLLQRVMLAANFPLVSVPTHIADAIAEYLNFKEITAHVTREELKRAPSCYKQLEPGEKMLLLHFCLADCKYDALHRLELLPLSNGTFTTFSNEGDFIYISSPEHPKELLPGLSHRFLDEGVHADIFQKLNVAAKQECTQLRILGKYDVPTLLHEALPSKWSQGETVLWYPNDEKQNNPPENWILLMWRYLTENFHTAEDIHHFRSLPLIPLGMGQTAVTLTRLCYPSRVVAKRFYGDAIDDRLTNVLKTLGVIVLTDCPTFVIHHPAVLGIFVHRPFAAGVLKALEVSSSKMKAGMFREIARKRLSSKEKRVLRSFLASVRQEDLTMDGRKVLQSLPLFETLSKKFVSKQDGLCAAPLRPLPIPIPALQELIDISQEESKRLAILLEVRILEPIELLCEMIFPYIQKGRYYGEQIDKLMPFVFKQFDNVIRSDATFKRKIQELPFVAKQGKRVTPKEVFDPRNETLLKLFAQEDAFPVGEVYNHSVALDMLEELGMKCDLTWEDIAERAESVQRLNEVNSRAAIKRAKVLLDVTEGKLKRMANMPPDAVLTRILRAQFLPVLQKPESFPLAWKSDQFPSGRRVLVAPNMIFLKEKMYLVCCTEPIVDLDIPKRMCKLLRLNDRKITAEHVLKQLEGALSINMDTLDRNGCEEVARICTEAYSYLQDNMDSLVLSAKQFLLERKFILVEKHKLFVSAARVAFEISADCSPYLFKLPEDFSDRFSEIMAFSGVRRQFEATDYTSSLVAIKQKFHEGQLDETTLQVAVNIANQLAATLEKSGVDPCEVRDKLGLVFLPDSGKVMRDVDELCFKECPWMPDDPDKLFVHEKVPWSTCEQLAVETQRDGALQQHEIGLPFGQREKLTNRLKRILTCYQGEKEILKELVQNADDAQATEICFIKDPRYHPDKRVFKNSWKPLQGPALCVYNNKPFTTTDIEGICNLGEGNKGEDPNKTGQYGVGFNAVYQLTDAPSFISKGDEIGDVFCVFDPNYKYIAPSRNKQGSSEASRPGRMFKDIDMLKTKFPDVFPCYLEEHFPLQNATMFRFPLRSEEMARESHICRTSLTVEKLDEMMEDLKKELFEVLIFVNNVKKITLAALDESGNMIKNYFVEVVMSQGDARKREEFSCYLTKIGKQVKEKKILPVNVKVRKRSYTLQLQDNNGNSEKWLMVQQVGFEKPVPKSVIDASQGHRLGMLPRGGVACLLDSTSKIQRVKRAYCFLPLPLRTNLPVHINGHFALDHENRRNLWRNEAGDCQSDWNSALLGDVISSCYLTLLDEVREFIQLPISQDPTCSALTCGKTTIFRRISRYERLFPSYPMDDSFWLTLADALYQEMNKKKMRLIPLVRGVDTGICVRSKDYKRPESVELSWLPPTGTGRDQAYFNDLEIKGYFAPLPPRPDEKEKDRNRREQSRIRQKASFEETLLETGFNLVAFSLKVFHSLKQAGVEVYCVSPSAVMEFYKSFSDDDPLCKIGAVACHVGETTFKDTEGVVRVLKYCKDDEHFLESLSGLPLLLTQDNCLHPFSQRQPRCLTTYGNILPRSKHLFVHSKVHNEVFNSVDPRNVAVFRPLDVETFASQLHLTLPPLYHSEDHYVKWYPDNRSLPNSQWIYRVWDFLQDFARAATKETDVKEGSIAEFIRDLFSPLSKWSLLPCTEKSSFRDKQSVVTPILVPLNRAGAVLDFKDCGTSDQTLVDALRNLGFPELNKVALTSHGIGSVWCSGWNSYELARNLVATVSSPHSLLFALNQKLLLDPSSLDNKLKLRDAIVILDYFCRNIKSLTDADRGMLKKLPFYQSANGVLRNLEGKSTFVIPSEVPAKEICIVEAKLGCLLLRSRQNLADLYEFLQLKSTSLVEVYTNFVLKCFQHLSFEGRMTHLQFIRDYISLIGGNENEGETAEKERLFDYLKVVKLIPSTDGKWRTVSSFYDPHNDVFVAMLPQESFPPDVFNSEEWITFLRKIGLVQDVSHHDFLTFTKQVEREAKTGRTDDTYRKSKVLVCHLISRPNVVGEGLLPLVRDIAFVAADPVDERLQAVCQPFGGTNEVQIPFIAFSGAVVSDHEKIAWTQAHLLPRWADPRHQKYKLCCPHGNFKWYLNNLLAQLKVLTIPSVDLVVMHLKTICNQFAGNISEKDHVSSENLSTVMEVMQSTYSFLQEHAMTDSEAKRQLQKSPCILVDQGRKLILPKHAILELYESLEIKPFLYRVPPEFGMFHSLFEFLGCSKTATPIHYAMVLEMLQRNSQGETLHPNEVRTCSRAVEGFIDSLQEKSADVSTLSTMYLPAVSSRDRVQNSTINTIPISLQESKKLLFDDCPGYGNRIQGLNQPFVLDLSLMKDRCKSTEVNYEDLLMKLPKPLQPTMLSLVVKEALTYQEQTVLVTTDVVDALKQQLSSGHFALGIARIIKDACSREGNGKGVTADIEKGLQTIKLFAVESLNTSLFHNDVLIPGSARDVPYFKEKLQVSDEHRWRVYVSANTTKDDKIALSSLVAKVIVEIYGERIGKNAVVIPHMLLCPPTRIRSLLDTYSIRKDDSLSAVEMTIFPEPGTLIPIEEHHLLDDAFEKFEPKDFVGCQLHDPSLYLMEGTATYIYAIIIEQVTDESVGLLTKTYRINIGKDKEPVLVNGTDLFKFCRLQTIFDGHSGCHRSKEEVFDEISNILEETWKTCESEGEKLQIMKRLCLRWHPKKNAGNEEFYTSVYEHIKSEVSRLGGSYDEFFAFWDETAREHGSQREEYRKTVFDRCGPQPGEAKRWLKQATADLKAGSKEFHFSTSSFEWVCFKFHQAAEKALKAARFNRDADKLNVHNLVDNSHDLGDPELLGLARALEDLVGDSTRMRYPDRMSYPKIPNEVYSHGMAQRASEIAEKIVERVKARHVYSC